MKQTHLILALAAGLGVSITATAADRQGAVVHMAKAGGGQFKGPKPAEIAEAIK